MKVLALVHAPVFSGPHNTMTVVANILGQQGTHVTVVLPEEGQAAAERMRASGVDVVTMPLHRMRALPDPRVQLEWARTLRTEVAALADLIERDNYDVVLTHTLPNLHGPFAARRANVALSWAIIDTFPPPAVRYAYAPFVVGMSDSVLTTGHQVGLDHPGTRRFGDRWIEYFPCVDVEKFRHDDATAKSARAELGLAPEAMVIGNVAAINPMKGHHTFIDAAAELRRTHPNTQFVILGSEHPGKEDYYAGLWDHVKRAGFTLGGDFVVRDPTTRVNELAQAFDVFWMTSEPHSEGVPTVIGEAKALGIPVVATDVGSTSECVTPNVSGFLTPPRDPAAIAAATRRILDDEGTRRRMSAAARLEAEGQYAAERGAAQHQLAFERAVAHHRSSRRRRRRS